MLISACFVCKNRTHYLKGALPLMIESANRNPPVEIIVLDYNSEDDLKEYILQVVDIPFAEGNFLTFPYILHEKYFHVAHARNAVVKASMGDYIIQLEAEAMAGIHFIKTIRERIEEYQPKWIYENGTGRYQVFERGEFLASGGYDERFTHYAPEDKDMRDRMRRRGNNPIVYPRGLIAQIYNTPEEKMENLDTKEYKGSALQVKRAIGKKMAKIYHANVRNNILVANEGKEWGEFDGWRTYDEHTKSFVIHKRKVQPS